MAGIERDKLCAQHYLSGMAVSDIGGLVGIGYYAVRGALRRCGIEILARRMPQSYVPHNKQQVPDSEIKRLHALGKGSNQIAKALACTACLVRQRLRTFGLKPNSPRFDVATNLESQIGGKAFKLLGNRDWLYKQYVTRRLTTRAIGLAAGCGKKAVGSALRRFNIGPRRGGDAQDLVAKRQRGFRQLAPDSAVGKLDNKRWLMTMFIRRNKSITEIATLTGVSRRCVNSWLRRHGIRKSRDKWLVCSLRRAVPASSRRISTGKAGKILCHSQWEVQCAELLDDHPAVGSFAKDTIEIAYVFKKRQWIYLPDFLVRLSDGRTIVVEIKAKRFASSAMVLVKQKALVEYTTRMGWDYLMVSGNTKPKFNKLLAYLDAVMS